MPAPTTATSTWRSRSRSPPSPRPCRHVGRCGIYSCSCQSLSTDCRRARRERELAEAPVALDGRVVAVGRPVLAHPAGPLGILEGVVERQHLHASAPPQRRGSARSARGSAGSASGQPRFHGSTSAMTTPSPSSLPRATISAGWLRPPRSARPCTMSLIPPCTTSTSAPSTAPLEAARGSRRCARRRRRGCGSRSAGRACAAQYEVLALAGRRPRTSRRAGSGSQPGLPAVIESPRPDHRDAIVAVRRPWVCSP